MRYISDRIAVIHKGRIVELADAEELVAHPLHPYTRSLLSAIPMPDPRRERNKRLLVYDPAMHDYSTEAPQWRELRPQHWVLCSTAEAEPGWAITKFLCRNKHFSQISRDKAIVVLSLFYFSQFVH